MNKNICVLFIIFEINFGKNHRVELKYFTKNITMNETYTFMSKSYMSQNDFLKWIYAIFRFKKKTSENFDFFKLYRFHVTCNELVKKIWHACKSQK